MEEKHKMIPLKDLNLTDRFLFDEVMEDPQVQQDALSIVFGREIPLLEKNETEKEFRISPIVRSIRMDVFSVDKEHTVYNTEMQQQRKTDLAKRSRYYFSGSLSGRTGLYFGRRCSANLFEYTWNK